MEAILSNKFTFNGTLNYSNALFKSPPVAAGFGSNVAQQPLQSMQMFSTLPDQLILISLPKPNHRGIGLLPSKQQYTTPLDSS